jgi:hypothetical protein
MPNTNSSPYEHFRPHSFSLGRIDKRLIFCFSYNNAPNEIYKEKAGWGWGKKKWRGEKEKIGLLKSLGR